MEANMQRVERLLALSLLHDMRDASQGDKVLVLNRVGFSNVEIADLLGTTSAVVSQQLHLSRKAKKRNKAGG